MKQHHDKCSQRYMASEEECNVIQRQRTLLLHQRELLDQQLAQLDNVSNISLYKLTYLFIYGLFDRDRYKSCGLYNSPTESIIAFVALANFQCPSLEGPLK